MIKGFVLAIALLILFRDQPNFTNLRSVTASRFLKKILSRSDVDRLRPSRIFNVSRGYIVPPSGSNGQSEAKTTLSRAKKSKPALVAATAVKAAVSVQKSCLK